MANVTNALWTAVYNTLTGSPALAGLTVTRDEYPSGTMPSVAGDIQIKLTGGKIVRLFGSELQQYNIRISIMTRGDTTFAVATELHTTIRTLLEAGFVVVGGTFIYCLAQNLPMQEDSKPIDQCEATYICEVQV